MLTYSGAAAQWEKMADKALADYDIDDLNDYLLEKGISVNIAEEFHHNKVCGAAFLSLTEEDLRELVPLVGVRTTIWNLLIKVSRIILAEK